MSQNEVQVLVPSVMRNIFETYGYAPAVAVGDIVFCAGQVGRTSDLAVIDDPEAQFRACWQNLSTVLAEAGCTLDNIVDLVSYHVDMHAHFATFKSVKNELFPRHLSAWTAIGIQALSRPGLLVELKAVAVRGRKK